MGILYVSYLLQKNIREKAKEIKGKKVTIKELDKTGKNVFGRKMYKKTVHLRDDMLIKRKVKEVPETEEEKKNKEYKRMRNVGLASLGTGATIGALRILDKGLNKQKSGKENRESTQKTSRVLGIAAPSLAALGAGLAGYGEIKRRNLKKKVKEEGEKKDDNTKE